MTIDNPFNSISTNGKGYSAIVEVENRPDTPAEKTPNETVMLSNNRSMPRSWDRCLFFLAGILLMIMLSLTPFHIHCITDECRSELEKELRAESAELEKEDIIVVEEKVEIEQDAVELAKLHAKLARERIERCRDIDWLEACERLGEAGARRRERRLEEAAPIFNIMEEDLLESDDPAVVFDENCLRRYRMKFENQITFPYHASQLLHAGGEQTMALFIQHGAMRDADTYFCSFAKMMMEQTYRPFRDILVIAPNFEYKKDEKTYPYDAFWNSTKPWGDWRDGAESDPECCGNNVEKGLFQTVSSFDIIDRMLAMLTDRELYPNMNKISVLGHSAGGQMVQRYAITSLLAAAYDEEEIDWIDMQFVVANPSSYTYLDERRFSYNCGHCKCTPDNCTCPSECTEPSSELTIPSRKGVGRSKWPCFDSDYNNWPYGLAELSDAKHTLPYVAKSGPRRAASAYYRRNMVYMVGQNDTCNDGLPVCDESCWKREDYGEDEWPCFRNHMDARCEAMLEGPFRRQRGINYMNYLADKYGQPTHTLYVIPDVGHNATGMFGSEIGLNVIFS